MRDRNEFELPCIAELSLAELETVSAGKGKSGGSTSRPPTEYLVITLDDVIITNVHTS